MEIGNKLSIYLKDIPFNEAQKIFREALEAAGLWGILEIEDILINENALGRVLAEPVWAKLSSPHYHASAMDGFAVRAEETEGAMPTDPVTLKVGSQTAYVDTGDPLPEWASSVVPIEEVESLDETGNPATDVRHPFVIHLRAALAPWQHVRPMGEDIVATQLVLPAGHILRPVDLGAIAACGHSQVRVTRLPRVGIVPTGSELVPVGQRVASGEIVEYNSIVLAAQIREWGGLPQRYPITLDDHGQIRQRVQEAANVNDLVLINAGSSAGSEDFTAEVVEELGRLLVHGVAIRPGHPVILGMIHRYVEGKRQEEQIVPVIGVPGYPVSTALTGELFVKPLITLWRGCALRDPIEVDATLTRKVTSPAGDDDYMRVVIGRVGEHLLAAPLSRGAGMITSMVKADGITIIPRGVQGLEMGSIVKVRLYQSANEFENTIFTIGSHDMTLDLLAQYLSERGRRLVSANVGSLGGLVSLSRGEAHLSGSHLLDPATGEYNLSYIQKYLPGVPVRLVTWVWRDQGLIVSKGNPKGIKSLEDLTRPGVLFINRQRGAGTRVLLDYHLKQQGISPELIHGYQQEEYTHLAVAAAVASNRADCGLGVAAAAYALDLDFIPLFHERYDLVIPCEHLVGDLLAPLFNLMEDHTFRREVATLPGYNVSQMGEVVIEC